jgi:hypothetical protein
MHVLFHDAVWNRDRNESGCSNHVELQSSGFHSVESRNQRAFYMLRPVLAQIEKMVRSRGCSGSGLFLRGGYFPILNDNLAPVNEP